MLLFAFVCCIVICIEVLCDSSYLIGHIDSNAPYIIALSLGFLLTEGGAILNSTLCSLQLKHELILSLYKHPHGHSGTGSWQGLRSCLTI